ncbi:MAG: hypothetical protein VB082_02520 [Christensenella sp.]|nr:hypothetical protein [Christensenella sp.]
MEFNGIDIETIVRKAMRSIVGNSILLSGKQNESGKVAAIFTDYIPAPEQCRKFLIQRYGNGIDCLLLNGCEFSGAGISPILLEKPEQELFARLEKAEKVALVTPGFGLLRNIAGGEDRDAVPRAVLRALLWGAQVSVVLDFEPPRFARNTFFEKIVDTLDALKGMGIDVDTYYSKKKKDACVLSLITEESVLEAHKQGIKAIACSRGALVTPLGRDALKEYGIGLQESGG